MVLWLMGPAVFATLSQALALFCVFGYLHRQRPSEPMRDWAAGWGLGAVHYAMALANVFIGMNWLRSLSFVTALGMSYYLFRGALRLGHRAMPRWVGLVHGAAVLWTVGTNLSDDVYVYAGIPILIIGSTTLFAGLTIQRHAIDGPGRRLAAGALIVYGLHQYNYPVAIANPELTPWGFVLAAMLEMLAAVGFFFIDHEAALRSASESAARFRVLFENLPLGIYKTTPTGRFVEANPALLDMLGYPDAEALGAIDIATELYVDPTERASLMGRTRGDVLLPTEVSWRHRDGHAVKVVIQGRRVKNAVGQTQFFEGIVRDITESHRVAQILERSQRMEALGRLAGGVAHDFNNLLTVIHGATDVLRLDTEAGGDSAALLGDIHDAAARASTLTQNLLSMARGRVGVHAVVDAAAAVRDAERMLARILEGHRLVLDLEPGPLGVRVEAGALDQVLLNMAVNAAAAMPSGGEFRVALGRTELGHQEAGRFAVPEGAYVRLSLSDTGSGMDEETQRRIFEPFFTTREQTGGTGLGLATVYSLIERSQGRIDVESTLGQGTCFTILWPLVTGEEVLAVSAAKRQPRMQGRRVTVLDDEPKVLGAVGDMLRALGYLPTLMLPEQAERRLAEGSVPPCDLLLSDVMLGQGRSGVELCRRLRGACPGVPVLFMSGYPADMLEEVSDAAFIEKPFTSSQLGERLEDLAASPSEGALDVPKAQTASG